MEKRLLLAIVLSFLVLVLYQVVFVKKPSPQDLSQPPPEPRLEERVVEPQAAKSSSPEKKTTPAVIPSGSPVSAESEQTVEVITPLYRAVWSNRGAVLRSWKLSDHKNETGEDMELVSTAEAPENRYPFAIDTEDPGLESRLNASLFRPSLRLLQVAEGEEKRLSFEFDNGLGTRVEKVFVFRGGSYDIDTRVSLWNDGKEIQARIFWGPGIGNPSPQERGQRFGSASGFSALAAGNIYRMAENKYKPEQNAFNFVNWSAYEDTYFTALFFYPERNGAVVFIKEETEQAPLFYLSTSTPAKAFIGPKKYETLKEFAPEAKKLINFGFFGSIAEVLLLAIRFIHKAFPNWGVSIIVLTLIIKILFFPLTYSSTKSMARMQELQPKIKSLRAKYKKSKTDIAQRRQMNEEMMRLYKEHGINPAGGCLPILIQIPVFWGFFRLLVVAIEFRHSPFVFWLKDLSVKDPYLVTPILMGITQFISQKMTPTSAEPSQARMMLIMPVVMTIFFLGFPSGLVLYWLTSNVLQIAQQYIMNRMMQKKKRESHDRKR